MPSDDAGYGALEQAAVLKVEVKVSMIKQLDNEVAMKSSEIQNPGRLGGSEFKC